MVSVDASVSASLLQTMSTIRPFEDDAELTPRSVHRGVPSIADRAAGYDLPTRSVDGDRACATFERAQQAVEQVLR
jgi:hypothetical protein